MQLKWSHQTPTTSTERYDKLPASAYTRMGIHAGQCLGNYGQVVFEAVLDTYMGVKHLDTEERDPALGVGGISSQYSHANHRKRWPLFLWE